MQRKNYKSQYNFYDLIIQNFLSSIWLQYGGPDASFDTHIDIFMNKISPSPYKVKYAIFDIYDKVDLHGIGQKKRQDHSKIPLNYFFVYTHKVFV